MTNTVDAVAVYTNLVFQLMAGEANHAIKAFQLPLPQITAQAVADFRVASSSTNISGSLTASNYTFVFADGYLEKFYTSACAPEWGDQIFALLTVQIFGTSGPRDPELERIGGERLQAAGATNEHLADFALSRVATNRYGTGELTACALWRARDCNALLQADPATHVINAAGFNVRPHPFEKQPLKVPVSIKITEKAFATNRVVAVGCGSGTASADITRAAMQQCFAGLKANLGNRPLKALLIGENLNATQVVVEEARKLAPNVQCGVVSFPWLNPPSFPKDLAARYAAQSRGVVMVALTGETNVRLVNVDFLNRTDSAGADPELSAMEEKSSRLNVREFLAAHKITGHASRHELAVLPASRFSWQRASAFRDIMPIRIGGFGVVPSLCLTTIDGVTKTNVPLGILYEGQFSLGRRTLDLTRSPADELLSFHDNWLVSTYEQIGEPTMRILQSATNAQVFRLHSRSESQQPNRSNLDGFPIKKTGRTRGKEVVRAVVREILVPVPRVDPTVHTLDSNCIFDPGLGFRLLSPQGSVSAVVCLGCGRIQWIARDLAGKELSNGSRHLEMGSKKSLAQAGLKGLPGDPALIKVADR